MQLHKILSTAGFLCLLFGAGCMDSRYLFTPMAVAIIGLCLLVWAAHESGFIRRAFKSKEKGGKKKW